MPDQIGPVADLLNRYGFAKEAEVAYKAFIARDPRQPERALALAHFLARQDRVAEAMAILKKAWSTCRPEQVAASALLVFDASAVTQADKRQVEAWLSAAVQKRPDLVLLASKLGAIWIYQGLFDEAEELFRRLLAGAPENVDALNNLAWLLALREPAQTQEALELINRTIEVQGATPSLVDTRAVVLIRSGKFDRAVQELQNAQASGSQKPSLALHLAWAHQAGGQTEEARKDLRQAAKLGWKVEKSDPLERSYIDKLMKGLGSTVPPIMDQR